MDRSERTADLHQNEGLNCAQAILTAFGESVGIDKEQAKALGRTLSGGVAGSAGMCGYLTAAMIILALAKHDSDEQQARKNTHPAVTELLKRFKEKNGHHKCKNLLGADMSTPEGKEKIEKEKLVAKYCYGFGRDAAKILEELL